MQKQTLHTKSSSTQIRKTEKYCDMAVGGAMLFR